jgi:hypothetical protein
MNTSRGSDRPVAFTWLLMSAFAAAAPASSDLFTAELRTDAGLSLMPAPAYPVLRSRTVGVALDALASLRTGRAPIRLALFDDTVLTVAMESPLSEGGTDFDARGRVLGEPMSRVILVRRGDLLAGSVFRPGHPTIALLPAGPHVVRIVEPDAGATTTLRCGVNDGRSETAAGGDRSNVCLPPVSTLIGYPADAATTGDLMVYYTPSALAAVGGSVATLEAQVALAVQIANTAYNDSAINFQLRVVRIAPIPYAESPDPWVNLDRLVAPDDGFLDQVHAERDLYGGDLVSLWTDNSLQAGGVAYFPWELFPNDNGLSGFSVMRIDAAPFETLAHEIGHNFGCQHDRQTNPDGGWYAFSFGYREPGAAWKTIMAYPPGSTVLYFSNPNLNYSGPFGNPGPLGVPGENPNLSCDNARTHNLNAFTIANFRPSIVSPTPLARVYVRASAPPGGDGASWATALQDVQSAIGLAVRARGVVTEVWVAAGTYKPDLGTGNREFSFRPVEGVTIYGGFAGTETQLSQRNVPANPTILDGDIGTPAVTDNSYHVVDLSGLNATAVLDGFVIQRGQADGDTWPHYAGAGVRAECSAAVLRNCTIRNNFAAYLGGGAYVLHGQPRFEHCVFESNDAEYGGGAENVDAAPIYADCEFRFNDAVAGGGGLHLAGSDAKISGCTFTSNSADFGGALRSLDGDPAVADCVFHLNSARFAGAAMFDFSGNPQVTSATFTYNLSEFAGAMLVDGPGVAAMVSGLFETNEARDGDEPGIGAGGGLVISNGATGVVSAEFRNNYAGFGGAGCAVFNASPTLRDCRFTENESWYGAGLWCSDNASVRIERSGFFGNVARYGGAGAHSSEATSTFYNAIFSANAVPENVGGAILNVGGGAKTYVNCTFAGNSALFGGAAIWSEGGPSHLRNCIVYSHAGTAIQPANGGTVTVTHSTVQGGYAGTGNTSADPQFVDPDGPDSLPGTPDDDLRLQSTSPAIDASDNTALPQDVTLDYAGRPRYRDVPSVPDTGVGDARPRADRGAHEFNPVLPGDMNCDGVLSVGDIAGFVLALTNPSAYAVQYPQCEISAADLNGDTVISVGDIATFVALLTG